MLSPCPAVRFVDVASQNYGASTSSLPLDSNELVLETRVQCLSSLSQTERPSAMRENLVLQRRFFSLARLDSVRAEPFLATKGGCAAVLQYAAVP